jgi:hypothetical protein
MNTNLITFKSVLISIVCLISLLSGCTTQYMQPQAIAPRNSAKIYIVRPSAFWGNALTAPVYVNNNYIGRIGNGGQLTWVVQPGPVTVSTSEGTAAILVEHRAPHSISFETKKGKSYYVKVISPYQIQFAAPAFGDAAFELQLMGN